MIHEEIREDADLHFIGKTDAQILRELFGGRARRRIALPDERPEHQDGVAAAPEDEIGSKPH